MSIQLNLLSKKNNQSKGIGDKMKNKQTNEQTQKETTTKTARHTERS